MYLAPLGGLHTYLGGIVISVNPLIPAAAPLTIGVAPAGPLLDVIWNVTAVCGWNCADCCVAAIEVRQKGGKVLISTPELDRYEEIPADASKGNLFDQALLHRQKQGLELSLDGKIRILDNLAGHRVRLDISGGDALSPRENYAVLEAAAARLGKENITLTATGSGLAHYDIQALAGMISELNFTFDGEPDPTDPLRPAAYAAGNLRRAKKFTALGMSTRAECPLSSQNLEPEKLTVIYRQLHDAGVSKLLLMRLFPVGRGEFHPESVPTNEQYRTAIATLRRLEGEYGTPKVKLQCALRLMEGPSETNHCDAVTESFGLMWDGTLLGSPWAINKAGRPADRAWVLGNLATTTMTEILESEKVRRMRARSGENHGQCKIFAWLNGSSPRAEDRIFEKADPMYAEALDGVA